MLIERMKTQILKNTDDNMTAKLTLFQMITQTKGNMTTPS
jgi:hypothetical protein